MENALPSAEQIEARLAPLTMRQIDKLAQLSGVPAPTIYKIKLGTTKNPGVETLRRFMPHVETVLAEAELIGAPGAPAVPAAAEAAHG